MGAQEKFVWPDGQRCAVSLTYDDALPVHFQTVAPMLSEQGLAATFYVVAKERFTEHIEPWKQVAQMGHELGNHSLFHPCRREPEENYSWLAECYDLRDYTPERWLDEMRVANCLLRLIDDRTERSFGNTCCNTVLGRPPAQEELSTLIRKLFVAGRGPNNDRAILPDNLNYGALGHFSGDAKSFEQLRATIMEAMEHGGWVVFMFHGVGASTHRLFIDPDEHNQLTHFLKRESESIWTAPLVEVASYLKRMGNPDAQ